MTHEGFQPRRRGGVVGDQQLPLGVEAIEPEPDGLDQQLLDIGIVIEHCPGAQSNLVGDPVETCAVETMPCDHAASCMHQLSPAALLLFRSGHATLLRNTYTRNGLFECFFTGYAILFAMYSNKRQQIHRTHHKIIMIKGDTP